MEDAQKLLEKIRAGVNASFLREEFILEEVDVMKVPFFEYNLEENESYYKHFKGLVLIQFQDNEKERLYVCFSKETDREIADYIGFFVLNNELIGAVFELKKSKIQESVTKASKQIKSTYPLVKMFFEKTTGCSPENLKVIGIRVFGPNEVSGKRKIGKLSKNDRIILPDKVEQKNFVIVSFQQGHSEAALISLKALKEKLKRKNLLW